MSNELRIKDMEEKIDELNAVSPTMCLAKWKTSTTTLYNGMTHSCHHPTQHKIKVEDILANYRGLHNTPTKLAARQDMLNGVQTKECDYCWKIENLNQKHFSDRHYKSTSSYMGIWTTFDEVLKSGLGENIAPAYFEVAFESTCNFKCSYCSPDVSSRWMEEINQHGPYHLDDDELHHDLRWLKKQDRIPIHFKEENPYVAAFWQWWPELYQSLNTFRITGGEPLLSKHTWKVVDYIIEQPRPDLKFSINTNMCVPDKLIDKLISSVNSMHGKIEEISIFTSTESTGAQAEYSRFGMDWDVFKTNCERFLRETPDDVKLFFMTTVNVFSASTFDKFLLWISDMRKEFNTDIAHSRIAFSVSYLRWPNFLCITQLDKEQKQLFAKRMTNVLAEIAVREPMVQLYLEEIDMVNRLVDFMMSAEQDKKELNNFSLFIDEYDHRRDTNFHETFPELSFMYNQGLE